MSLPQGRDLFKRLIARSSVLCENYSPGQMDRWELGYEVLREVSPGLTYLQISGMGKSGTYDDYLSVGPTAQALSGLTHLSGLPEPMLPAGWGYSYLNHSTDPQLKARGAFVPLPHSEIGTWPIEDFPAAVTTCRSALAARRAWVRTTTRCIVTCSGCPLRKLPSSERTGSFEQPSSFEPSSWGQCDC